MEMVDIVFRSTVFIIQFYSFVLNMYREVLNFLHKYCAYVKESIFLQKIVRVC